MRIGVCTGGGDCPGLNAAIRAVVKHGVRNHSMDVIGIFDSFQGLMVSPTRTRSLGLEDVKDVLNRGGTFLGTHNKGYATDKGENIERTVAGARSLGLDMLIVIGGEGTQGIALELVRAGLPVIGIPKTIDNDLPGTEQTIGFASCVDLVAESVMRLQSTAESHDRIMILEVMGRDSGYIALNGAIAGGAHVVLLPEIPFSFDSVIGKINQRKALGRNYSVIVVSEGAFEKGGKPMYTSSSSGTRNLGGIGQYLADGLFERCKMETRVTVLGHLQRGGQPSATDKLLASRMGVYAVELAARGEGNQLVVLKDGKIKNIPYFGIDSFKRRLVPLKDETLFTAKALGICIGE